MAVRPGHPGPGKLRLIPRCSSRDSYTLAAEAARSNSETFRSANSGSDHSQGFALPKHGVREVRQLSPSSSLRLLLAATIVPLFMIVGLDRVVLAGVEHYLCRPTQNRLDPTIA